jgi:hypothetical protein
MNSKHFEVKIYICFFTRKLFKTIYLKNNNEFLLFATFLAEI